MKKIIIDGIEYDITPSNPVTERNSPERIEVLKCWADSVTYDLNRDGKMKNPVYKHYYHTNRSIPEEKLVHIKQAIEQVLNDDMVTEIEISARYPNKTYTEDDLRKAFDQARSTDNTKMYKVITAKSNETFFSVGYVYPLFEDYIKSLHPISNDPIIQP